MQADPAGDICSCRRRLDCRTIGGTTAPRCDASRLIWQQRDNGHSNLQITIRSCLRVGMDQMQHLMMARALATLSKKDAERAKRRRPRILRVLGR